MLFPDRDAADLGAQAIADAVNVLGTVRGYPFVPADQLNPPCVVVLPPALARLTFGGGWWEIRYPVELHVSEAWDRAAQLSMMSLLPQVWAALEAIEAPDGWSAATVLDQVAPMSPSDGAGYQFAVQFTLPGATPEP